MARADAKHAAFIAAAKEGTGNSSGGGGGGKTTRAFRWHQPRLFCVSVCVFGYLFYGYALLYSTRVLVQVVGLWKR